MVIIWIRIHLVWHNFNIHHLTRIEQGWIETNAKEKIDTERLKKNDAILFFDEVHLFEDELDDNGVSIMTAKIRVMPSCFLVLLRFWLRIDHVLFNIIDTRLYHQFGTPFVLREHQTREAKYQSVSRMLPADKHQFTDSNLVYPLLSVKSIQMEKINLL